jgi:hypothetical protein
MEWWIYLLVFLVLVFSVLVIYFSFIYPKKLQRKKLASDLIKRPNKVVVSPEDVKLFLSFKFNDLENVKPEPDYQESGVFGFYVDKPIFNQDDFYPIYLTKDETSIWHGIFKVKQELAKKNKKFKNVDAYLEKHRLKLENISFFIIQDYNLENFNYWTEILETNINGFNRK